MLRKAKLAGLLLGARIILGAGLAHSQTLEVVAITGSSVPGGVLATAGPPAAISQGITLFQAEVDVGAFDDPSAIFLRRPTGLELIVVEPHVMPGGQYELQTLRNAGQTAPFVNARGDVLFSAEYGPVGGVNFTRDGLFLSDGATRVVRPVVRDEDLAPGGNGRLYVSLLNDPALNQGGTVAFWAEVLGAVGGLGNGSGIFRGNGGALTQIARTGQVPPDGLGSFDGFSGPAINGLGDVSFVGLIDNSPNGDEGVFRGNGVELIQIARVGDEPLAGWEIAGFTPVGGVCINASRNVAFRARIDDPNTDAIFVSNGSVTQRVAYGGQPLERGTGTIPFSINRNLAFNDRGHVAFMAQYVNTFAGIFRAGFGGLKTIAIVGDPVPGTASGTFQWVAGYPFALNAHGDVVFEASFRNGSVSQRGIFLFSDEFGLRLVVQPGTALAGGVVDSFDLLGTESASFRAGLSSALGDDGSVSFRFTLVDDRVGIARYRSPYVFRDGFESGDLSAWSQ